jgi:hypothetical protein
VRLLFDFALEVVPERLYFQMCTTRSLRTEPTFIGATGLPQRAW